MMTETKNFILHGANRGARFSRTTGRIVGTVSLLRVSARVGMANWIMENVHNKNY